MLVSLIHLGLPYCLAQSLRQSQRRREKGRRAILLESKEDKRDDMEGNDMEKGENRDTQTHKTCAPRESKNTTECHNSGAFC